MNKNRITFLTVWILLVSGARAGVIDETGVEGGLVVVVGYDSATCDEMIEAVESGPYVIRILDREKLLLFVSKCFKINILPIKIKCVSFTCWP